MPILPDGTVTFLFTDIEGSTKLWEEYPEQMRAALARHDALLRQAIEDNAGAVFKTVGDAFCAAFATAPDALNAALMAQLTLCAEVWPDALILRVRMALHTGAAELRDKDYFGQPLNRVARLLNAGHGGQTLLSDVAHDLTRDTLPPDVTLRALGEHRLRDLGRAEPVFQLLHPGLPDTFAPLRSLDSPDLPNNLPRQMTSFIGREREITAVKTLLNKTRLLTLTGSGGCGKTRLSLQVAADVLEHYADGVWFVELAPLADPALVAPTLAQTLSVSEEPGRPLVQTLANALKAKRLLIVLDNCEHLLDACALLADALLRNCPHIRILASSREGLHIAGEQAYRLPSLTLPDTRQTQTLQSVTQYEAVRLFVERALAVQSTFAVTNANAPALAQLCARLDGIPLAIELAAARIRSLSIEEINSKLDNRFRLLTGGNRTALPRQQTLRALIDWSYDLLTPQEKMLLCRLSVFAGGWTLGAAEQVCVGASDTQEDIEEWEVLDLLTGLVDKSLVVAQQDQERTRYRLLVSVRQYARERLTESGEEPAARTRHADCFLGLAEEVHSKLYGPEQAQWFEVLEEEHDNLRQALTLYAEDADEDEAAVEKGLRLGVVLQMFWRRGYPSEGRERLHTALRHPQGQEPPASRAAALNVAGVLARMQNDYAEARVLLEESLTLRRKLGDKKGIASCLISLGICALNQQDYDGARVLYEQSLALARELGHKGDIGNCLNNLGDVAYFQGDHARARVLFEQSLELGRELGNENLVAINLSNLGNVATEQGDYARARTLHKDSLAIARELGYRRYIACSLEAFGALAGKEAQAKRSVRLWGAAAALREAIECPLSPADREKHEREMTPIREMLGEDAFALAWSEGHAMTTEQAIVYALEKEV